MTAIQRAFPTALPTVSMPQAKGSAEAAGDVGQLPEWNLTDLYTAPDAPEVARDLAAAAEAARALKERFQGKLSGADPDVLADSIGEYERLSDLLGKLGSFAGLLYAADQSDTALAKFYGDVSEKLTAISTDLIFFELELNKIDDDALAGAAAHPRVARFKPWLDDLRKEKPHQLDERIETLFHEKGQTSRGAFEPAVQ